MSIKYTLALALATFLFVGTPARGATGTSARCKEAKARAAGQKADALLNAMGKNISRKSDLRLAASVSKAQSKFTRSFGKAEARGGCETTGDVEEIEAKVDAFVLRVVEGQGPTCGNGITGGPEECDAGNLDGQGVFPGCDSGVCLPGCVCAPCGDGKLTAPEQCDDGTALNGSPASCCAADCTLLPSGTTCPDTDGDACTSAGCDGTGFCDQSFMTEPDGSTPTGCDATGCSTQMCQAGTCVSTSSSCCTGSGGLFTFESGVPSGTCGVLQNFRCSNAIGMTCENDADCDFGYCVTMFGICSGDTSISCASDADCVGTCVEQSGIGLPLDLACGGAYTGGGKNSVTLPWVIPDMIKTVFEVNACNDVTGQMTLGPATAADLAGMANPERHCTQGRRCAIAGTPCVADSDCPASNLCETRCLLGPPLPLPDPDPDFGPFTSLCAINVVVEDGSGTVQCDGGATDLSLPMSTLVYRNGDLLSSFEGPVDVPGRQPCPLCTRQCSVTRGPCESDGDCKVCSGTCVGGIDDGSICASSGDCASQECNAGAYCQMDADCNGGTCDVTAETCSAITACLGGPGDGDACAAETSGPSVLGSLFPTSHDCALDPLLLIKRIGAEGSFSFDLTTGAVELRAKDNMNQDRVFCGFCRDDTTTGSLCFEGDPDTACVVEGNGAAVPCVDDSGCTPPYESCKQRNPGAFTRAGTTRISVAGATAGECLGDGAPHAASLASIFCISPSFGSGTDSGGDFPGPGAAMVNGTVRLSP